MIFDWFTDDEPKHCDRSRRMSPRTAGDIGGLLKVHGEINGHVYRRYTKWSSHCDLPTMTFYKCMKCDMHTTGAVSGFYRRARKQTCLEHAVRELRYDNEYRGRKAIEQVCDDEALIEDHQFAEGIGVPVSLF